MTYILLADSDSTVRTALRMLLSRRLPGSNLDEADDWATLQQKMKAAHPDLLLLDWRLHDRPDCTALRDWIQAAQPMRVAGMSIEPDDRGLVLAAGAQMFVYKGESPERVIRQLQDLVDSQPISNFQSPEA